MDFVFGEHATTRKSDTDFTEHLPPIIKRVIAFCRTLPDNKLLFNEDIAVNIKCSLSALRGDARRTPITYSIVSSVELKDRYSGNSIIRRKRIYGNEKTIEAYKQWLEKSKQLK